MCLRETRPNRRPTIFKSLNRGSPSGTLSLWPRCLRRSLLLLAAVLRMGQSTAAGGHRIPARGEPGPPGGAAIPPAPPDRRPATPPGREMQSRQPAPPCFPRRNRHGHHPVLVSPAINKIGQMPPFITLNDVWVSTKAKKGKIRLTAAKPYRQIVNNSSRIGHLAQ